MNRFILWRGRIRAFFNNCPACNSDAPKAYDCPVCLDWYGHHRPMYPAPSNIQAEWWNRFVNPQDAAGDYRGCHAPDLTPRWKKAVRWLLQAYWRSLEVKEPSEVTLPGLKGAQAKDALVCQIGINVSFLDKLRLLCGCTMRVTAVTYCENLPGMVHTETTAFVTFD